MQLNRRLTMMAMILGALCVSRPAQAQACAMQCNPCWYGVSGYAGEAETTNPAAAHYTLSECVPFATGCDACGGSEMRQVASNTTADAVARRIRGASTAELASMVKRDGGRLLVSTSRNVVVVRGTACNPKAFGAVVAVTKAQVAELSRLGVASLESLPAEPATPR